MALNQSVIDSVNRINLAFMENADWFPSDLVKLANLIHAYEEALAMRPSVAAHGGSSAEEIRFNMDVSERVIVALKSDYHREARKQGRRGGLITVQHQLSRNGTRWCGTEQSGAARGQ